MGAELGALKQEWIESRPPKIREIARRFPPDCYRLRDTRGHYHIYSYGETTDGRVVIQVAHGADSNLPGVMVFGIDPEELIHCSCGRWEWPSEEQTLITAALLEEKWGVAVTPERLEDDDGS